jgi:hypothetical protein
MTGMMISVATGVMVDGTTITIILEVIAETTGSDLHGS